MGKMLFTLLVLICNLTHLFANDDVHVIEIRYAVFVENTDSLSSFQYNLPYETIHIVSPDRILTMNKYAADVDETHIYDLENKFTYQCFFKDGDQGIAAKSPMTKIPSLVTDKSDDKTYQIGGMQCKRYEILVQDKLAEIFTTDAFGINFTPFSQVQGYAMQYSFVDEVYGKVTYVAKSIYPTLISAATFSLDGFQITDEIFPQDLRNPVDEVLITKESKSLFKLNKKDIDYKFKLVDKSIVTDESNPNNLTVMAICGFFKLSSFDVGLMKDLIGSLEGKNVDFYYFAKKNEYSDTEIDDLENAGFKVAYLKDLLMSKFKIDYFPTFILLDKDRKVIKYKIGMDSDMLSTFGKKILELNDD